MDWRAVRKCELITETLNAKPQALHDSYVWDSPIAPHSDGFLNARGRTMGVVGM